MTCIVALIALLFPRAIMVALWLLTDWFSNVFDGLFLPLLGFIFLPFTTLWYAVVMHYFDGEWGILTGLIMFLAVCSDLGTTRGGWKSRKRQRRSKY